ncbi:MAG: two-component system response regulator, partial [Anaerolineae bacterium]
IVDDEPSVVEFIERALSEVGEGYRFERASDGYEAGLKVASFEPNLVILDLVMPRVDGFEVCRRIKSDPETLGTKVLVVTGYPEEVERAKESGADDYLVKPLRVEELREKVRNLMRRRAPAAASRRG